MSFQLTSKLSNRFKGNFWQGEAGRPRPLKPSTDGYDRFFIVLPKIVLTGRSHPLAAKKSPPTQANPTLKYNSPGFKHHTTL
jgi:hypothetical protein